MKNIVLIIVILFSTIANGQEVVSGLRINPEAAYINKTLSKIKQQTSLPFFDDFSAGSNLLDATLWEGNSVFVNRSYPIDPVTIGVATFDGLNAKGLAYNINSNIAGNADTLTSASIDLTAVDTAYMLFYYQPQGLGDNPQLGDSLFLEFKDVNGDWNIVWKKEGSYSHDFKKQVFLLSTADYLIADFQFRFRNIATLTGNFDHWHIDYVKVDEFINPLDTLKLEDVSFVYESPYFLSRYSQMPWAHFKNNEAAELKDTISVLLRNNGAGINIDYQYNVYENGNIISHYPTLGPTRNVSVFDYDAIGIFAFTNPPVSVANSVFSSVVIDSASFLIEHIINTGVNDNKWNDTLYHTQEFNSHFSYDDGTAELAYGLNVSGAKLAYQFKLNRPDTLRAIQMYFPQMLDSVNMISFKLTVWNDNGGVPGSIIHQQTEYPKHTKDRKFHYYYLDSLFQMTGVFYVGWEQQTNDLLNVGLDKNKVSSEYLFYNVGAGWSNSQFQGSWMIRPVVSMEEIIINDVKSYNAQLQIFPNPVNDYFTLVSNSSDKLISIYNLQGILVKQLNVNTASVTINTSDLSAGMYVVELKSELGKVYQKIIKR